jgi:hypothetical protein
VFCLLYRNKKLCPTILLILLIPGVAAGKAATPSSPEVPSAIAISAIAINIAGNFVKKRFKIRAFLHKFFPAILFILESGLHSETLSSFPNLLTFFKNYELTIIPAVQSESDRNRQQTALLPHTCPRHAY